MTGKTLQESNKPFDQGILLTQPAALKTIKNGLLFKLMKPVGTLFGANIPGALADAVDVIIPAETDAETGWRLVYCALEHAIDQLAAPVQTYELTTIDMPFEQSLNFLRDQGVEPVDLTQIRIDNRFLSQPKSLALLNPAKANLEALLVHYGISTAEAHTIADRLPSYFVHALEQTMAKHRTAQQAIHTITQSDLAKSGAQERAWECKHARLHKEIAEPLFGEPYSIEQLYQPLRAYRELKDEQDQVTRPVADLETEMNQWVQAARRDDAVRVICGGPGSGKSSFAKLWASRFDPAATRKVLLVPLHKTDDQNLEEAIARYCKADLEFTKDPINGEAAEEQLLLILDGLDELSMAGKSGLAAAQDLIDQVGRLVDKKNGKQARLLVVIGGREILVDSLKHRLNRAHTWHLMPYHHIDPTLEKHEQRRFSFADGEENVDQRDDWWRRWGELIGRDDLTGFPGNIAKNQKLADLARQPLLNHLLARAERRGKLEIGQATNINEIYRDLLEDVFERTWGTDRSLGSPKLKVHEEIKLDDFTTIFDNIGLAAWQYGTIRTVSFTIVDQTIEQDAPLKTKLERFSGEFKDKKALTLLASFFGRESEKVRGEQVFEFTHKSFPEYFAARGIVREISRIREGLKVAVYKPSNAIDDWYKRFHAARITPEIMDFLQLELATEAGDDISAWRDDLITLFNHNLAVGMPITAVRGAGGAASLRELERFTAAAERALLASIAACTRVIIEQCDGDHSDENVERIRWRVAWPDDVDENAKNLTSASDLLRRLERGAGTDQFVLGCISGINLERQFIRTRLAFADCEFTNARGATLMHANLTAANLKHANLTHANLTAANLTAANLTIATLERANLEHANLTAANLTAANLTAANLTAANLTAANLTAANLTHANLKHANLERAKGLTLEQLDSALTYAGAKLPDSIEEQLANRGS